MKYIVAAIILAMLMSCGGSSVDRPTPVLTPAQVQKSNATQAAPAIPSGAVAGGVNHYECPQGHEGGAAEGACSQCGQAYIHNQAYHNQAVTQTTETLPGTTNAGVNHYECPQGHEGGEAEGTCSNCGQAYVHNQAYHDQAVTQVNEPLAPTATPGAPATPPTPEPAQNASGVWHYTCPNGHTGGAGSAAACGECGTTLAHNTVYHN